MKKGMRTFLIAVLMIGTGYMHNFSLLHAAPAAEAQAQMVNINTASLEELQTLHGIGPAIAHRIVEYRQTNGGFKNPDELVQVRGIGEAKYQKLKNQIAV
jgi:competence protein ComEA